MSDMTTKEEILYPGANQGDFACVKAIYKKIVSDRLVISKAIDRLVISKAIDRLVISKKQ